MSMPATADDRIYQVYPDSKGDRQHYLAAFALATGQKLWKQPLFGEIITAPVLAEGHVYIAATTEAVPGCERAAAVETARRLGDGRAFHLPIPSAA